MTAVDSGAVLPAPYLREDLADFAGYSSARTSGPATDGPGDWAWLNANEAAAANQGDPTGASRRYPDPQPGRLRARLARTWGVRPEELLVVRGSDEGIDVLVRGCTAPGEGAIVVAPPTFGMYAVSARLHGVAVAEAPQLLVAADRDRFELDAGAVREAVATTGAGLVFVASPGNPTGTTVPAAELAALAADLSGRALLVVDEAYGDFSDQPSATALLAGHENVVVLRTLSKAHGLAGARIGAVIAQPELVAALGRVQAPYPLAVPAIELALAATEPDALAATTERVWRTVAERERVASTLSDAVRAGRAGSIRCVMAGEANFVTVRADDPAAVMDALAGSGVVARSLAGHPALSDGVRITVGQEHENDRVLAALTGTPAPATQTTQTAATRTTQETP